MSQNTKATRFNHCFFSSSAAALVALVLFIAPLANATDAMKTPATPIDHSKMAGMNNMQGMAHADGMKHMEGMSMTGDVDYDFAINMRMHHQMAVDMSQAQLKNGKTPQLRAMATSIIAAQKKEIAALNAWLATAKKPMPVK